VIPYRIETLFQYEPWANKVLFGVTIAASLALEAGAFPEEVVQQYFIWGDGGPVALLGYLFAHAGIFHLAGNMVFLWVFGNAVCATVGNWAYLALYLGLGVFAGLVHMIVGGEPVVGASGAISGVVGVAVALYPSNRVNLYYSLGLLPRTGRVALWAIALYWTAWDILGAMLHLGAVAYWAHLGGTAAGLAAGLALLATRRAELTEFDHGSLLDLVLRRTPPHKLQAASAETLAELRRTELAFASSLPTPQPAINLGAPATATAAKPLTIPLRREGPNIRLSGGVPVEAARAPAAQRVTVDHATPAIRSARGLPDVSYFWFDGQSRHGPVPRAQFLATIAQAPDTTAYWFWAEGMAAWLPVVELSSIASSAAPAQRS
jgi:membrane associated rhomboid family serine protease